MKIKVDCTWRLSELMAARGLHSTTDLIDALVDLEPVRGNEANKRRPAVIVSNDRANATAARLGRGVVTVVPITSNTGNVFPFQTLLPAEATGFQQDSKAQAEQVRSIAVERLGAVLGRVPADVMTHIDDALRLHLQL